MTSIISGDTRYAAEIPGIKKKKRKEKWGIHSKENML